MTMMVRLVTTIMMRMVTTMRTLTIMMMLLLPVLVAVRSRGISGQLQFLFTNCDPARPLLVNITRQPLKFNLIFDRQRALDLLALASKAIAVKANKQSESLSSGESGGQSTLMNRRFLQLSRVALCRSHSPKKSS